MQNTCQTPRRCSLNKAIPPRSWSSSCCYTACLEHKVKTPSSKVREAFALLELGSRQGSDPSVAQMAGKGPKAEDAEVGPTSLRGYLG